MSTKSLVKSQLILNVAIDMGYVTEDVRVIVDKMFDIMLERLCQGDEISFVDFGRFYINHQPPKMQYSFKQGTTYLAPAKSYVKFRAGRLMEELVGPIVLDETQVITPIKGPRKARPNHPKRKHKLCNTLESPLTSPETNSTAFPNG